MAVAFAVIQTWHYRMQEAMVEANNASQRWEKRKRWMLRDFEEHPVDGFVQRQRMSEDWELNDAMDAWNFWEREAKRFSAALLAEKAFRELKDAQR